MTSINQIAEHTEVLTNLSIRTSPTMALAVVSVLQASIKKLINQLQASSHLLPTPFIALTKTIINNWRRLWEPEQKSCLVLRKITPPFHTIKPCPNKKHNQKYISTNLHATTITTVHTNPWNKRLDSAWKHPHDVWSVFRLEKWISSDDGRDEKI